MEANKTKTRRPEPFFHQFFHSIQNQIQTNFLQKQPKISAPDRIGSTAVRVSALTVKNGDVRPRVRSPLGAEQVIDLVLADRKNEALLMPRRSKPLLLPIFLINSKLDSIQISFETTNQKKQDQNDTIKFYFSLSLHTHF